MPACVVVFTSKQYKKKLFQLCKTKCNSSGFQAKQRKRPNAIHSKMWPGSRKTGLIAFFKKKIVTGIKVFSSLRAPIWSVASSK